LYWEKGKKIMQWLRIEDGLKQRCHPELAMWV
jgi:hypothetical protein